MPAQAPDLITAEELETIDVPGKSTELVRGRLVAHEPPGSYHGEIAAKLTYLLGAHVYPRTLGELYGQDTGFKLRSDPDTVRGPDVAFVAANRVDRLKRGYSAIVPDLVAEIVSPDDRASELLTKVAEYLDVGVRVVWVIDPQRGVAHVHRPDESIAVIGSDGALMADEVLPGFRCELAELLG
jgi:Uma2 family endonuclease